MAFQRIVLYVDADKKWYCNSVGEPLETSDYPIIEYGGEFVLCLQFYDVDLADATVVTNHAFSATDAFILRADSDITVDDELMIYSSEANGDINQAGDWIDGATADKTSGQVSIRINTLTTKFQTFMNSLTVRSPKSLAALLQIFKIPAGETNESTILNSFFWGAAKIYTTSGEPTPTDPDYLNATQIAQGYVSRSSYNLAGLVGLTVASGVITKTQCFHSITMESGTTDDLVTINGGTEGEKLLLVLNTVTDTLTIKHGTGNILTPAGVDLDLTGSGFIEFIYDGSNWLSMASQSISGDYYTRAQTDTLLSGKQDIDADAVENNLAKFDASGNTVDAGVASSDFMQFGGTQATLTDDSDNYITLGAIASIRAVTVQFTLDDSLGNVHYYTTNVYHDGTSSDDTTEFAVFGTEMTTITIDSDISSGNLRLKITLASVGTALNCVYNIVNKVNIAS